MINRRQALLSAAAAATFVALPSSAISATRPSPQDILQGWFSLTLELVRHTATYSPPVASRAFAYLSITAFEAVASLSPALQSLAGQLPGLEPLPKNPDRKPDWPVVLQAALSASVTEFFSNTGPSGQRAVASLRKKFDAAVNLKANPKSTAHGLAIANHIINWSKSDGGAVVTNLGFPESYTPKPGPARWVPTSAIRLQQAPLLPAWGANRTFAMPKASTCSLPPPPAYSEDKTSQFYKEALEVYETVKNATAEQKTIARFWSDDPMLSSTPPGHWLFVTLDILKDRNASIEDSADVMARLSIAVADAFIACWDDKYKYDLLRPVTYIKRLIDKSWEPILITPPFPEYPSGHSSQSGAAEVVLTKFFGDNFAFEDRTHVREKFEPRKFASFREAAENAGISRLYGGIHFRAAIERGLEQGRCIGAYANALKTKVQS